MSVKITINGRLVKDPELRFTNGGKAVAQFSVVTSRRNKTDAGVWEDVDVSFHDVTAFGDMAEHVCDCLAKGTSVIVTGALRQESWQDKEGKERRAWRVLAEDIALSVRWKKLSEISGGASLRNDDYNEEAPF
jgi:single-strand DNA-binding protein